MCSMANPVQAGSSAAAAAAILNKTSYWQIIAQKSNKKTYAQLKIQFVD